MKKIIRILLGSAFMCVLAIALVGCNNNSVEKNIDAAKQAINNKEYNKAESALQNVIDQDSSNREAKELMNIVSNYEGAVLHYTAGEYKDALKELNEIPAEYKDYKIKDDIDNLKHEVAFQMDKAKDVTGYIKKAKDLIKKNKYDEAEKVIEMIDVNSPNKAQKEEINNLMTEISKHDDQD